MKEIIINKNEAGQRMDKLLAKILSCAGKSFIYKMLRKKNIVLNDKKATGNEILKEKDSIKIYFSDETYEKMTGAVSKTLSKENYNDIKIPFDKMIVYEDENILVANKPVGVLSQKADKDDVSMNEYLIWYMLDSKMISKEQLLSFRPAFVNRLDRNTSGLMVAGKSLMGLQCMTAIIRNRMADKYYLALVSGKVTQKKHLEGYLSKDSASNTVRVYESADDKNIKIITEYEPVKISQDVSLLKIKLITGKTHQIRVHLASNGHGIIGDYKYGNKMINDIYKKEYGIKSQLLHSYEMHINKCDESEKLGISGQKFVAPLPKNFEKIVKEKL